MVQKQLAARTEIWWHYGWMSPATVESLLILVKETTIGDWENLMIKLRAVRKLMKSPNTRNIFCDEASNHYQGIAAQQHRIIPPMSQPA